MSKCKKKPEKVPDTKLLLYSTYLVVFFDFLSAITTLLLAFRMIFSSFDWSSFFVLIFSIFWWTLVIVLLVGIWKNRPSCVRSWIIFSCIVIVLETLFVIYGAFKEATITARHMQSAILLLLGLILESVFVYVVLLFTRQIACECWQKKKRCSCSRKKDPNCKKPKKKKKSKK